MRYSIRYGFSSLNVSTSLVSSIFSLVFQNLSYFIKRYFLFFGLMSYPLRHAHVPLNKPVAMCSRFTTNEFYRSELNEWIHPSAVAQNVVLVLVPSVFTFEVRCWFTQHDTYTPWMFESIWAALLDWGFSLLGHTKGSFKCPHMPRWNPLCSVFYSGAVHIVPAKSES